MNQCFLLFCVGLLASELTAQEIRANTKFDTNAIDSKTINVNVPHTSADLSVKYNYDIVYVRARRPGDKIHKRFYSDFSQTFKSVIKNEAKRNDGSSSTFVAGHTVDDLFFHLKPDDDKPVNLFIDEVRLFDAGSRS